MTSDTLVTVIIVAAAFGFVGYRLYAWIRGSNRGCGECKAAPKKGPPAGK